MTDDSTQTDDLPRKGLLGWVTRNSRAITALSAASIPIVLALIGYFTNQTINDQNLKKEYVNLAVSTLAEPDNVEPCTFEIRSTAVPELQQLTIAQQAVDARDAGDDAALETTLDSARAAVNAPLTEEQIRMLVGNSDKRALRRYALDLLSSATPIGAGLDKRQYVALLCGEISVGDPTAATSDGPDAATSAAIGANEDAIEDLVTTDAQLFATTTTAQDRPLGDDCLLVVTAPVGQIDDDGIVSTASLPPGTYRGVAKRTIEAPTDDAPATPPAEFVRLENGKWVKIRSGSVRFGDSGTCV